MRVHAWIRGQQGLLMIANPLAESHAELIIGKKSKDTYKQADLRNEI